MVRDKHSFDSFLIEVESKGRVQSKGMRRVFLLGKITDS